MSTTSILTAFQLRKDMELKAGVSLTKSELYDFCEKAFPDPTKVQLKMVGFWKNFNGDEFEVGVGIIKNSGQLRGRLSKGRIVVKGTSLPFQIDEKNQAALFGPVDPALPRAYGIQLTSFLMRDPFFRGGELIRSKETGKIYRMQGTCVEYEGSLCHIGTWANHKFVSAMPPIESSRTLAVCDVLPTYSNSLIKLNQYMIKMSLPKSLQFDSTLYPVGAKILVKENIGSESFSVLFPDGTSRLVNVKDLTC